MPAHDSKIKRGRNGWEYKVTLNANFDANSMYASIQPYRVQKFIAGGDKAHGSDITTGNVIFSWMGANGGVASHTQTKLTRLEAPTSFLIQFRATIVDTHLKCILSDSTTYTLKQTIVSGREERMMLSGHATLASWRWPYVACAREYICYYFYLCFCCYLSL